MSSENSLDTGDTPADASADSSVDRESAGDEPATALSDREKLEGELARLDAENERLREAYAQRTQTQYRQTALALVAVGVLAAIGGLLFVAARTVLFALAGTGLFLGVLTYYLSPEQFLSAAVGREVYETLADNEAQLVAELGLSDSRLYVYDGDRDDVRLYVPQSEGAALLDSSAFDETFVVDGADRGVAFEPSGAPLFVEFEQALTSELADDPAELAPQLTDALVEQFELVDSAEQSATGTPEEGTVSVGVVDSAYGPPGQFDHPVASFLAVGLAQGLQTSVRLTVDTDGNDRVDAVVSCHWPVEAETDSEEL